MASKKEMKHYRVEIKLEAVRLCLEEGKTRAEIAQRLGLRWEEQVKKWVSQYRHEVDAFHKSIGRPRQLTKIIGLDLDEPLVMSCLDAATN